MPQIAVRHQRGAHHPRQGATQSVGGIAEGPAHPAGHAAHDGQVDQRHNQGCGQNEDQRHWQHAHEFTWNAGPEQHWQEGTERRRSGGDHRPEHALCGLDVGVHRAGAFGDPLVGVFDHHDGAIHQHAHRKDEAEHHDVGDRNPHQGEKGEAQQEGGRDREPHKQGGAAAKRGEHHDHDQRHRGQYRAFELAHHGADNTALVVGGAECHRGLQLRRPFFLGLCKRGFDLLDRIDEVEALALYHLQGKRVAAVEPGGALTVLEGEVDFGQFAQRHDAVAVGFDRQAIDILDTVEGGRDLDRERALVAFDFARRQSTGCCSGPH